MGKQKNASLRNLFNIVVPKSDLFSFRARVRNIWPLSMNYRVSNAPGSTFTILSPSLKFEPQKRAHLTFIFVIDIRRPHVQLLKYNVLLLIYLR